MYNEKNSSTTKEGNKAPSAAGSREAICRMSPEGPLRSSEGEVGGASATKHKSQPHWLACLVDYTGKSSNFFEDLLKVEKNSRYIKIKVE